jgi:hypothetical protein
MSLPLAVSTLPCDLFSRPRINRGLSRSRYGLAQHESKAVLGYKRRSAGHERPVVLLRGQVLAQVPSLVEIYERTSESFDNLMLANRARLFRFHNMMAIVTVTTPANTSTR